MSWEDDCDEDPADLLGDIYDDTLDHLLRTQRFGDRLSSFGVEPIPGLMDLWLREEHVAGSAGGSVVLMNGDEETGRMQVVLEHIVETDGIHLRLEALHMKHPLDVSQIAALSDALDYAFRSVMNGPDDAE